MLHSVRKSLSRRSVGLSRKADALSAKSSVPVRNMSWRGPGAVGGASSTSSSSVAAAPSAGECRMCQDVLGPEACVTACGHRFCRSCIEKQLRASNGVRACETCGKSISMFSVRWLDSGLAIRDRPVKSLLDGMQFIQFGQLGLESMHFSRDTCYLAYDSKVCPASWKLDNGSALPARVEFAKGWSFDEPSRTFRGTVSWAKASFRGVKEQRYEIRFDEAYDVIESGKMVLSKADGSRHERLFGGDKMQNVHYRRLGKTIYGQSYVRVPNPNESAEATQIVQSLSKLGSWGLGIKKENVETMLWSELPLLHLGVFSLHFGEQRSYVDLSLVEGFHPSRVYFERFKFYPETRTFKGETVGEPEWDNLGGRVQWLLHFDDNLERIIWGKIKHFDAAGKVCKEEVTGWQEASAQRYLMVAPWQTLDNPAGNKRFAQLEGLFKQA